MKKIWYLLLRHRFIVGAAAIAGITIFLAFADLTDTAATLLGAFLGAFAAVVGAAWYSHSERRSNAKEFALALRLIVEPLLLEAENALELATLDDAGEKGLEEALRKSLLDTTALTAVAIVDIEEMKQHMGSFGAVNIVGILDLHRSLKHLDKVVNDFWKWHSGRLMLPGRPIDALKESFAEAKDSASWLYEI